MNQCCESRSGRIWTFFLDPELLLSEPVCFKCKEYKVECSIREIAINLLYFLIDSKAFSLNPDQELLKKLLLITDPERIIPDYQH